MNVVIVGSRTFDSLEYHLNDSFQALGHQSSILDVTDGLPLSPKLNYWASRFIKPYDRSMGVWLAHKVARLNPDLVLIVYRNLHPVLVDEVRKRVPGVVLVQMNPDALSNLERQQIIAANFDYYFSKDPYIVNFLRDKARLNAHYLPEAFNQRIHQKPPVAKVVAEWLTDIDVLVFGNLYAYRARMVEQLLRAGVNVAVYGTKGPYLSAGVRSAFRGHSLTGQEKNRMLYGARIVFNNFHYAEVTSVNQKYFEINGIGAFQLCDYKPTVDEYTGTDSRQVTYQSIDEAIVKIQYFLTHATERHELAARQCAHFQQYHTFDRRVSQLLRTIKLSSTSDELQTT